MIQTNAQVEKLLADETPTVTIRGGFVVKAKVDRDGRLWASTYANLTQARNAADKLGAGWEMCGTRPFYVRRVARREGSN